MQILTGEAANGSSKTPASVIDSWIDGGTTEIKAPGINAIANCARPVESLTGGVVECATTDAARSYKIKRVRTDGFKTVCGIRSRG